MAPPLMNPLNDQHREILDKVLASIVPALDCCQRIEASGIDMTEEKQRLVDQQARAKALKANFFPDHP